MIRARRAAGLWPVADTSRSFVVVTLGRKGGRGARGLGRRAEDMTTRPNRNRLPQPPDNTLLPLVNASSDVAQWLEYYWAKLQLPPGEVRRLAVTDDRAEFHRWTGKRLNPLALGCYCFLPTPGASGGSEAARATLTAAVATRVQPALPGFDEPSDVLSAMDMDGDTGPAIAGDYRHLIFIEPDLLPLGVEVTVAHELIHLADRVSGNPRKHRCHGYDAISVDEAAVTERDPELLRAQLREETERREAALREKRPFKYIFECPHCLKEYPRVRRYTRPVSCGRCDRRYNPAYQLRLKQQLG